MKTIKPTPTHLLITIIALTLWIQPMNAFPTETPREYWKLPNGMKVVIQEDHSAPLVAIYTAVDAGPKKETHMTSGLSHFLEHLLFKGTRSRNVQEINALAEREGGYFNAYTTFDFTVFELVVPVSQFQEAVQLQADMLTDSIFPPEELERERKVVVEEIQRYKDDPESVVFDLSAKWLFTGHPYAEPILRSEEHTSELQSH